MHSKNRKNALVLNMLWIFNKEWRCKYNFFKYYTFRWDDQFTIFFLWRKHVNKWNTENIITRDSNSRLQMKCIIVSHRISASRCLCVFVYLSLQMGNWKTPGSRDLEFAHSNFFLPYQCTNKWKKTKLKNMEKEKNGKCSLHRQSTINN